MSRFLKTIQFAAVCLAALKPICSTALTVKFLDYRGVVGDVLTDAATPGQISARYVGAEFWKATTFEAQSNKLTGQQTARITGDAGHPLGSSLTMMVSDTDYIFRNGQGLGVSTYGTSDVTYYESRDRYGTTFVRFQSWIDPSNTLFGMANDIGTKTETWNDGTYTRQNWSHASVPLVDGQTYSITQMISYVTAGGDERRGTGDGLIYDLEISTAIVPLPATLPLLLSGLGLIGLGRIRPRLSDLPALVHGGSSAKFDLGCFSRTH